MNLFCRVLWVLIYSFFQKRQAYEGLCIRTPILVLPNDLDLNFHVNNGRYLTYSDLARIDLFVRTGILRTILANRWAPIVGEVDIKFRRAARLFDRIVIETTMERTDNKRFYILHKYFRGDVMIAEARVTGLLVGKNGVIPPAEVIELLAKLHS